MRQENLVEKVLDKQLQVCDTNEAEARSTVRSQSTLTTEEWKAEQQLEQHKSFLVSCQFDPNVCKYISDQQ
ncbi:hypothetical protein KDW_24840 [Dictyobacter vulcani]|uniref:Uncharacterized protein n=1 Tax=Dictyobacter vulcani TaxID=2607529 RepID=A0A5J4KME6_9CHLR|nr:hypothetical protein KDW_24840 [Dictyobacter vulcani]